MSRISAGLKKTIAEIKQLSDGSFNDQLKACEEYLRKLLNYGKPKPGVNESVIRELLPTIIKFMESNDHILQQEGAGFITDITCTPDEKANTQLLIDANVIPKLIHFLSSQNTDVLISALEACRNIANDFPENIFENGILQPMIQCLKSENNEVSYQAARCMTSISRESEERVAAIFDADGVKPLIEILDSKNNDACRYALGSLINITFCNEQYCQRVIELGGLKSLKKFCDRLFVASKKDFSSVKEKKMVELWAIMLIRAFTTYDEARVDLVIQDNHIPLILQQIKSGMTPDIKIQSIIVVENIVSAKRDLIPTFIDDHIIISLLYNNLQSTNINLLITTLTAIRKIVKNFEDKDFTRQKIRECGGATQLTNLCKHKNENIRRLSTKLYKFVFDVKRVPTAGVPAADINRETKLIEVDDDEDIPAVESPQTRRQQKRPATTQSARPLRRSKRFRVSLEKTDTDDIDSNDDENDHYNDFDDHPRSSSSAGVAQTESNRHDHFARQSIVGEDTVAADELSRLNPKSERSPAPQEFDILATSASHQSPDLPVAASTDNETVQIEMKPSTVGRFGNSVPESVLTDERNNRSNPAGFQTAFNSETAATADETIRNGINPGKRSPNDADFGNPLSRPTTSTVSSALTVASASTNNGTIPNNIPSRNPLPAPKPVIVLRNQVTPPAAAANDDIIRDEIIKYWRPAEFLIHQYCGTLEIQFDRKDFDKFIPKIEFTQISSNSKSANIFQPIDHTGFGCLSILLTGNEDAASAIRMKINKKFIDDLSQSGNFDEEKITYIISPPFLMKEEHLQTITTWLKCRMLVYCNGWKKYGSWDEGNPMIPLFVLNKNEIDGKIQYSIVLTLKND